MNKIVIVTAALVAVLAMPSAAQYRDRGGPGGPHGPRAILFSKPGFSVRSLMVDRPIGKLAKFDFDDKPSSIMIRGGAWRVCVDDHFAGRCEILDRSIPDLAAIRMDNTISSIAPVGPGPGGPPPGY